MTCFEECTCSCGHDNFASFDACAGSELLRPPLLRSIVHSEIGWFMDRSLDDPLIGEWGLEEAQGVYLLWCKNDYCSQHEMFHMKSLYVGKGVTGRRLLAHYKHKDFKEPMLVYWTFYRCANRLSKYIEQLLLDTYSFPLNKAENPGRERLCAHFTQAEVD